MAYFPSGSAITDYEVRYCDKCAHRKDGGCPVMDVHLLYNQDQIGEDGEAQTIKTILSILIPTKDMNNLKCTLHTRRQSKRKRRVRLPMKGG